MIMRKSSLLTLIMLVAFSANTFSQQEQQIYRTIKGDIALTIQYKDTVIIAASNQLVAMLDYDTGKLIFHTRYNTFQTGLDSIDNKLKLLDVQELKFDGSLDIFINPKKKTAQKYNMTGMMTTATPPVAAEGNGTVFCVLVIGSDAVPACKLLATIKCKLSDLNLTSVFEGAGNDIQIDLRQSLLEKEKLN